MYRGSPVLPRFPALSPASKQEERGCVRKQARPDQGPTKPLPSHALHPGMNISAIGLERLCEVQAAIRDAGGDASVVIDSDDLVARPGATMAAYCAAVGLPFIPRALTWEPGERPEWRRSARWHVDVSVSSGFERRERVYPHTVGNSAELARFAARHRPFYERLYAQRLDVTPC